MGINIGNIEFTNILVGQDEISVYVGNEQVWPVLDNITFSNGFWIDEFPWDDNSCWMD